MNQGTQIIYCILVVVAPLLIVGLIVGVACILGGGK
jgi:hypothetical protein